ncbi:DUF4124 domain-containing protein [Gynuella sunshinyii]|uniref:DUF4124 domain-containing protein n=1 Tax=Gynuella sunshinyii YC6258 TaxID=1445510 RepID=A0A0C5VHZ0_9GAMM|nr:DUF4124 domain-containing protein [Gynuella sunshinyii]AJQ93886.1 hypothetical Protein YC6258_01842 [Gynuella sunshinyii YC6258]
MRSSLVILMLLVSGMGYAENKIYTWVDANGVTQYGDRPPLSSKAKEVKVDGYQATPVSIDVDKLPGQWTLAASSGEMQNWEILKDGQVQIDSRDNDDRMIITGKWVLEGSVMTIESTSIQQRINGLTTVSTDPIQYVYKFIEFEDDRFRVSNNSGTLRATRK